MFILPHAFSSAVKLLPSAFVPAGSKLVTARFLVEERYKKAQAGVVIDREAFVGIIQLMIEILDLSSKASGDAHLFSLFEIMKMLRQKRDAATEKR